MVMGCWTSSCHMESPWLSHCLSSGEIRYALTSGPSASSLVVLLGTHVCACHVWARIRAQKPGLAGQREEPRTRKHKFLAERTTSGRILYRKEHFRENPLLNSRLSAASLTPQSLGFPSSLQQALPTFLFSLLLPPLPPLLFPSPSPYIPPSVPASLPCATLADACHLPPCRASATTGCVWCHALGSEPSPGVPRLYSTPRRVGRTYGSLMGAPATCVKWSPWHILAWVSRGPWEQ